MKTNWPELKQLICSLLCDKQKPFVFAPDSLTSISGSVLRTILEEAYPDAHIRVADHSYDAFTHSELLRWLNADSLDKMRYIPEIADCDDFARESRCRMMRLNRIHNKNFIYAYSEGDTPLGYHAFSLSVCNGIIKIVEPQNDDTKNWRKSDYCPDFIQI